MCNYKAVTIVPFLWIPRRRLSDFESLPKDQVSLEVISCLLPEVTASQ